MQDDPQSGHFAHELNQRVDIALALETAGLGVWEFYPDTNELVCDERCRTFFGLKSDGQPALKDIVASIHPDEIDKLRAMLTDVVHQKPENAQEQLFRLSNEKNNLPQWVRVCGKVYLDDTGAIDRYAGVVQDVTEPVTRQQQLLQKTQTLAESEARFRGIVDQIPNAILVVRGDDFVVDQINFPMQELIGRGEDVIGRPFLSFMPELESEFAWEQVRKAYFEGIEYIGKEILVTHSRGDKVGDYYYNLAYRPLWENGAITGVIQAATDITEQVLARKKLEQTETKLRGVIAAAPAGIGLFIGRDLVIESANQTFIDIVGKGPGVEGRPLREAMPELLTEGQPFLKILDDVFTTGVAFVSPASLVKIVQNGILNDNYYNISYTPLRDSAGEIYGILDIAIDVTAQVMAVQALEEKEATLRGAIEIADMGIWELNMKTGITTYSERLRNLFEFTQEYIHWEHLYTPIHPNDRARIQAAVIHAAEPGSHGFLNEEYTIITQQTGRQRIVRAQAKMYFDKNGKPDKLAGSMRDITQERKLQWDLEQLVHQRTEELRIAYDELAATNEELAAGNEEYAAINKRMEEINNSLVRSNSHLETFAYVASHDLQEPLRKIQQFSSLLLSRCGAAIGEGLSYVERMQAAASRMSALIDDLLNFSRISTHRDISEVVSLQDVIGLVLSTLELKVKETGAQLDVDPLPDVMGDASQLTQLFQNLISNAIKFSSVDALGGPAVPVIRIRSGVVQVNDLPADVKPVRLAAQYHCISVSDNGVGFDEKYLDRIFQVFQRLHGRSEFAGTGIGLAISEKVVHNHGGAITASSKPGEGAVFRVYLPV